MSEIVQNETNQEKDELDEMDYSIIKIIIQNPNITDRDLSRRLGTTRQTANRRRNNEKVRRYLKKALEIQTDELRRLMAKSLLCIDNGLDDLDPSVNLKAASIVLKACNKFVDGKFITKAEIK